MGCVAGAELAGTAPTAMWDSGPQGGGTVRAGLCRVGTVLVWPQAAGVSCHRGCCMSSS